MDIGKLVLSAFTPIVLLIIGLGVASEKVPLVKKLVSAHCAIFEWSRLDVLFGDLHYRTDDRAMVFKKTAFGAAMSIATFVAFVGVGIALGVNSIMFPVYASSVSPQPPPWQPHGVYQLVVTVFGGGGMVDQCSTSTLNGTDNSFRINELNAADWSVAPTRVDNVHNPRDGSCTLTWRCDKRCSMLAITSATLRLSSPPRSWASYVSFKMSTPLFASNSTPLPEFGSAPFQFERSFYAPPGADQGANSFSALRGSATINIALTPYIVNASSSETKAVAFEPSLLGISFGNVTSFETFDFSRPDGFTLDFVLTRNTFSLVYTASSSAIVTFLVLLASVAGSVVGVFTVLVKRLEFMFDIRDESNSEHAKKHMPQVDVESDKAAPDLEAIEMNEVRFTANHTDSATMKLLQDAYQVQAEKIRNYESDVRNLKLSNQQSRMSAAALEQTVAANQQSIQQLTSTLAEVVQLLPVSDRSRQLQQHVHTSLTHQPSSSPPITTASPVFVAHYIASESISLSPSRAVTDPAHAQPMGGSALSGGNGDGYGEMRDDE